MENYIQTITEKFGLTQAQAQGISGGLMTLIQKHVPSSLFSQIATAIPQANTWISTYQQSASASKSPLGSLTGMATSMLGGKAQIASEAFEIFNKFQLDRSNTKDFTLAFAKMVQSKIDPQTFSQLTNQFPAIQEFLK
ncbi:MAG: DUF2780 domain-containing protein [Bdellovibrionales bacterium]|nr:DUF2780 domain-containing protein [Bdellovibrionales bacterium]